MEIKTGHLVILSTLCVVIGLTTGITALYDGGTFDWFNVVAILVCGIGAGIPIGAVMTGRGR